MHKNLLIALLSFSSFGCASQQTGITDGQKSTKGTKNDRASLQSRGAGTTNSDDAAAGKTGINSGGDSTSSVDDANAVGQTGGVPHSLQCRFADKNYKEQITNGPGVPLNPFDFPGGTWEGETYLFEFEAWQDFTSATGKVRVTDGAIVDAVHLKALARVSGLNGGWSLSAPSANWGIQHKYRGVLSSGRTQDCQIQLTENDVPFFDRPNDGCFALSTSILMADGKQKPIYLIKTGEKVFTRKGPATVAKILEGPEGKTGMIRVTTTRSDLLVTENHPFADPVEHVVRAKDLFPGMQVQSSDGEWTRIIKVERMPIDASQKVRNLVINPDSKQIGDHMIVANGVVTGDFMMQTANLETSWLSAVLDWRKTASNSAAPVVPGPWRSHHHTGAFLHR